MFDEVRQQADLVDVISRHTRDVKRSGGEHFALCPFHQENTPSLHITPQEGVWYCFGCQKGGDVIEFIAELEGLDRVDAAKRLAEDLDIEWSGQQQEDTDRGRELLGEAQDLFRHYLTETSHGRQFRDYLRDRDITDEIADKFGLGCTPPGSSELTDTLLERGYSSDELIEFGLAGQNERGIYDFFRDRITFPLHDTMGKLVGFSGRVIGSGSPKYINTRDTPLFSKKRVLYNYHRARKPIAQMGGVIVVEGFTDVISLAAHNLPNTVATSGTAFTEQHAERLARLTDQIRLCFDGDRAGLQAAVGATKQCLAAGVMPQIVLFGEDADPDDLARENPQALYRKLDDWQSAEVVAKKLYQRIGNDLERRRRIFSDFREMHEASSDFMLEQELLDRFSTTLNVARSDLESAVHGDIPTAPTDEDRDTEVRDGLVELIATAAHHPETFKEGALDVLRKIDLPEEAQAATEAIRADKPPSEWLSSPDTPFMRRVLEAFSENGKEPDDAGAMMTRMALRVYLHQLRRRSDEVAEQIRETDDQEEAVRLSRERLNLESARHEVMKRLRGNGG